MVNFLAPRTIFAPLMITALGLSLLACQSLPVTINGNTLNSAPLMSVNTIEDKHLAACVNEHVFDHKVSKPADLKQLNCSQRSIHTLNGLEIFTKLQKINLAGNPVESLKPLIAITSLEEVILGDWFAHCAEVAALHARGIKVNSACR